MRSVSKYCLQYFLLTICVAVIFMLPGCTTPDHNYDLEAIYKENPPQEEIPEVDQALIPVPELQQYPTLPKPEQGKVDLSLEQTVLLALQRNRELRVQLFEPVITGTFEQIERGVFDPELFADLIYTEETASETSRSTGERFSVEGEDLDAAAGVRQRLPLGTDLEASVSYERSASNRTPDQQVARIGLSITQSLLEGRGAAVNLVGIRQAQLETQASFYELQGFVQALVAEVETAYWQYVLTAEGIAIFESSLDIARQQLDEVEKRIEVGVLPRNAAAAARAEVARREQALIESRSIHEERRLRLLRLLYVTDENQFSLAVNPISPPRTSPTPVTDLDNRLELADRMRADLNEARLRSDQHRLETIRTRNGLLPKLDLFIDLGKTGYAESFSDAFKNLDGDNYELVAGVRFSNYIENRTAKAIDLAARASMEQAEIAVENLRNLVKMDVRLAINEIERARQQIEASAVTHMLQEQTLEAEQERFAIGRSTSLLVAQAQRDLLVSQLAEIEAIVAYRVALVSLYLAEGSLLERRGIQLKDSI
jgi:outer membrane protein TolC